MLHWDVPQHASDLALMVFFKQIVGLVIGYIVSLGKTPRKCPTSASFKVGSFEDTVGWDAGLDMIDQ